MANLNELTIHLERTRRRSLQYLFHPKHHGGDRNASQWDVNLTQIEEFSIFDVGDFNDIADEKENLFGILPGSERSLRIIGIWYEQIAKFPVAGLEEVWHGYPCWPLGEGAPGNLKDPKRIPNKLVFKKMLDKDLITRQQCKRLAKGDDA